MAKMEDAFNDFYNEFKDWTKKQILHRTFDIILKDTEEIGEKDKEIERLSKEVDMWNRKYNEQIDIINKLEKLIDSYELGKYDYEIPVVILKDKLKELKEGKE